jgi:uncharacterized membrane protein
VAPHIRLGWVVAGSAAFAVMALVQLVYPLRDEQAGLSVLIVVLMAAAALAFGAARWGRGRAFAAFGAVAGFTLALEWVGHTTGLPFGDYAYTGALQPEIAGVPAVVPLAWFAMALPAREVAIRLVGPGWARVAAGALALTAWDVFLDPQMVEAGFWVWEGGGPWRDVPLSNYAGWVVGSAVVMTLLDRVVPPGDARRPGGRGLLAIYAWMAFLSTFGFLVPFGDPVVAVVGGVAMGVPAVLAWRAELRPHRG